MRKDFENDFYEMYEDKLYSTRLNNFSDRHVIHKEQKDGVRSVKKFVGGCSKLWKDLSIGQEMWNLEKKKKEKYSLQ